MEEDLLVPLLVFSAPERRRAEITERLLQAAVPGPVKQRLAFAAVVADQQISSREQAELRMVKEAAVRFVDAPDLALNAPTLSAIYTRLPEDVKATVVFGTDLPGQKRQREPKQGEAADAALKEQTTKEQTMKEERAKEPTTGRKA
jgi:hypothetical protein